MEVAMNPFSNTLVGHWARRWRATRDRVRGEREIARLSPAMRRDIGWLEPDSRRPGWRDHIVDGR
jgi:hypothetical protein